SDAFDSRRVFANCRKAQTEAGLFYPCFARSAACRGRSSSAGERPDGLRRSRNTDWKGGERVSQKVFFSLEAARGQFGPCALSIGNFDGVHIGHQALLAFAQRYASNLRVSPAVLTFHPHPAVFVAPHRVPEMICGLEERLRRLTVAGAERILVLPFNHDVARLTAEEFVSKILVEGLRAKAVFVGENFRFGYKRAGDSQALECLGEQHGFTAHFIKPVKFRGQVVSSSLIRQNLTE